MNERWCSIGMRAARAGPVSAGRGRRHSQWLIHGTPSGAGLRQ